MPPKSFEQPHNPAERVAASMYNLADKVDGAKQPDLHRTFNEAANNFATENYDKGQRLLEKTGLWNDDLRAVASEANRVQGPESGRQPLTFGDAKRVIAGYGEGSRQNLEDTGGRQDLETARSLEAIMRDLDKPGQAGVEGLDKALNYIEGLLQTSTQFEQKMSAATKQRWDERRAVRDALFAEKQKRAEQLKQQQQTGERINHDRTSATRNLENLYANADVPENTPSRQELMRRVGRMSNEELHFLAAELRKIGAKFSASGDAKSLDAALSALVSKDLSKDAVVKHNRQKDGAELAAVRSSLATETKPGVPLPEDRRGLFRYYKDTFGNVEGASLDDFKRRFTAELQVKYQEWASKHVEVMIKEMPPAATYPDNVAQVLGNNVDFVQRLVSAKEGRLINADEVISMPFSQLATQYLNIKLPPDYSKHFSPRPNVRF